MRLDVEIFGIAVPLLSLGLAGAFLFLLYPFVFMSLVREAQAEFRALSPLKRWNSGAEGRVALEGVARVAEGTLVAPVSGLPCLAWSIRVISLGKITRPADYLNESKAVPFRLGAPVDRLVELGQGFGSPRYFPFDCRFVLGPGLGPGDEGWLRVGALEHFDKMHRAAEDFGVSYELREWRIEAGAECTISGLVREEPGTGALSVVDGVLARGGYDEARRRHSRALTRFLCLRIGLFLAIPIGIVALTAEF